MTAKFFGQFLLECGEIDEAELRLALELMEKENLTLGEFAVRSGFATEADCRRVNGEQRRKDVPFGELAVHMGVLNSIELEELLQRQRETRLELSTALVNLEFLSADRMHALSDAFKSEQRQLLPGEVELPPALARHHDAIRIGRGPLADSRHVLQTSHTTKNQSSVYMRPSVA